ncbi:diguanylate cyclase (GGDEF)-like protein [Kineococcus xinjiangensis]|uniref:Diguanylate cyclase (GGDEF)-like protein n=1 Tax=Kineococcus xinjiangensis TaxID=512762 RepID=A0A2S6IV74_9ACTN|nr:bifunctional diguanylate cyclase/phosphodiesterase [Kineococcus xinjiangensis]PPK98161.1 diguanylate cyclase (GGDEF)-like protein [Kineococcus xinjiangensis]
MQQRTQVVSALAGAALLASVGLLVPGFRTPLAVVATAAGAVLVLAGVLIHRPLKSMQWLLMAAMLTGLLGMQVATVVVGPESSWALALLTAARAAGFACIPLVLLSRETGEDRPRMTAELPIAGAGAALLAVQVALMIAAHRDPAPPWWELLVPAFDVFALVMLLHVFLSRRGLERSAVLGMAGGVTFLLTDLLVAVAGQDTAHPGDSVLSLTAAGSLLIGLSAMQSDMHHFGGVSPGRPVHSASARLLAALPAFATAPALWVLGLAGLLPPSGEILVVPAGYLLAGAGLAVALVALRRAERTSERDPLTDLVNRRGLLPAVEELRQRMPEGGLEVCLVDLDDFKQINDSRGHEVGDQLLVEVGHRLRAAVGDRGVVSRTGGDEFLVVVASSGDGWGAGDVVLTALDPPFECAGVPTLVTASVGVVTLPPGASPSMVLADADVAMYAAKQAGKGRALTYRPELRDRVLGDFGMQRELRALLDGADPDEVGRMIVLYQPIVALAPLRVSGAEALVRWEHPHQGMLLPAVFLDLVEAAGLGARLDEHVMTEAARQLAAWDAEGLPRLELNLNLGIGSMRRPNLGRVVATLVERYGLTPDRFHLEITEHDELPVEGPTASTFAALAAGGFQISLDDFGVGYTSLTYLRRFPVSIVKLDKSLTSLIEDSGDVPLMQGIAALCQALDVKLLAEGVENPEQVPVLRELGVQFAQGFHFARPLTATQFADLVLRAERGEDVAAELGVPILRPGLRELPAPRTRGEEDDTPRAREALSRAVTLGREPAEGS